MMMFSQSLRPSRKYHKFLFHVKKHREFFKKGCDFLAEFDYFEVFSKPYYGRCFLNLGFDPSTLLKYLLAYTLCRL